AKYTIEARAKKAAADFVKDPNYSDNLALEAAFFLIADPLKGAGEEEGDFEVLQRDLLRASTPWRESPLGTAPTSGSPDYMDYMRQKRALFSMFGIEIDKGIYNDSFGIAGLHQGLAAETAKFGMN